MTRRLVVSFALLAAACDPGSYGDLARPAIAVVIVEPGGFCTSVHAVDAEGVVWGSGGCGEGVGSLARRGEVGADVRGELDASMSEVLGLTDDPECALPSAGARQYRFVRTRPEGGEDDVRQCEPGVPLVAVQLAERLEGLAAAPLPDAGPPSDAGP